MGISQEKGVDRGQGDVGNGIDEGHKSYGATQPCELRLLIWRAGWPGEIHSDMVSPPRDTPIQICIVLVLNKQNLHHPQSWVHSSFPPGSTLDGMMPSFQSRKWQIALLPAEQFQPPYQAVPCRVPGQFSQLSICLSLRS